MTTSSKPRKNPFDDIDALQGGIDALFIKEQGEFQVALDDVEVVEQVRTEFEDETQSLEDLGKSLRKFQVHAVQLRTMPAGYPKPYRLVAGERRIRAARLVGMTHLRAVSRNLTDEEAEDWQFAENIHRKNLTQIEEARKVQRDLRALGSTEAVLNKYHKSRAWLSKMLSLLNLPEQAGRLIKERISADTEVIHGVRKIEQSNPQAARELVDKLRATRGQGDMRKKVEEVRDKAKRTGQKTKATRPAIQTAKTETADQILERLYLLAMTTKDGVKKFTDAYALDSVGVRDALHESFDQGRRATRIGPLLFAGLRDHTLGTTGAAGLRLAALIHGSDVGARGKLNINELVRILRA